jgi:hypothetical protein
MRMNTNMNINCIRQSLIYIVIPNLIQILSRVSGIQEKDGQINANRYVVPKRPSLLSLVAKIVIINLRYINVVSALNIHQCDYILILYRGTVFRIHLSNTG